MHVPLLHAVLVGLVTTMGMLPSQQRPPSVQWFDAAKVDGLRAGAAGPWQPLLSTSTLSIGRYRIAKGATDGQSPHRTDEVYHVIAGAAKLEAGGETRAVAAGDTIFVAAAVPHRFVDVTADLDVLVFFTAARATGGGMAAFPPPKEQTPFPETSLRGNARIFYWYGPDSAGQVAIDFGRPRWQPGYAKFVDQPSAQRWRFGENFWTSLDTNIPLTIGGVDVAIGQYYLVLQHRDGHDVELVLLDPAEVRRRRLDAYEAGKTSDGIVVPLERRAGARTAGELEIELIVDPAAKDRGTFVVRFGPHELTAPLQLHPARD